MRNLSHIGVIALNTFRESVRGKILYNIVFPCDRSSLFSILLGGWSVFDRAYVIKSTTLSIMSSPASLISVFVGIQPGCRNQRATRCSRFFPSRSAARFVHRGQVSRAHGGRGSCISPLLTGIFYVILAITHSGPDAGLRKPLYLVFCGWASSSLWRSLFLNSARLCWATVCNSAFTLRVTFPMNFWNR